MYFFFTLFRFALLLQTGFARGRVSGWLKGAQRPTVGTSRTTHLELPNYHGITFQNEVVRTAITVVPRSFQETCGSTMHA